MFDGTLATAVAFPLAQMGGGDGGMDWGIAMMIAMILVMLVLIGLAVLGVIWLVRSLRGKRATRQRDNEGGQEALRVLDRRLAEGEIEADEYRERRSILEHGG